MPCVGVAAATVMKWMSASVLGIDNSRFEIWRLPVELFSKWVTHISTTTPLILEFSQQLNDHVESADSVNCD